MRTARCLEVLAETRARVDVPLVADDVRLDLRRLRLGAARVATRARRARPRSSSPTCPQTCDRAAARPARRADLDRRADAARRRVDRRLAVPRHGDRDDRRAGRARPDARAARPSGSAPSPTCRSTPASASRRPSTRARPPSSSTASSSARARSRRPSRGPRELAPSSPRCAPDWMKQASNSLLQARFGAPPPTQARRIAAASRPDRASNSLLLAPRRA